MFLAIVWASKTCSGVSAEGAECAIGQWSLTSVARHAIQLTLRFRDFATRYVLCCS